MHRSTILSWPAGRLARAAPAAASAAPAPTLIWDRGGGPALTSWDFSIPANGAGETIAFRVVNSSQSASSALTITVTGSSAFNITKGNDTCTGTSLSPGAFCLVFINFFPLLPTTVGQTFSGTATARPASQDRPAVKLTLTATITPP